MNFYQLFEEYKKQFDHIRNADEWRKPEVLLGFREQYQRFTDDDINTLKFFLSDNEKKWFVAALLDVLDSFPVELLAPMLNAAVHEPDPSFNNDFIRPCRRVFDYVEIQQILLGIFQEGDKCRKIGVTKALYWARSTVYISHIIKLGDGDTYEEIRAKGYDTFRWEPEFEAFDDEFIEDLEVYEKESPGQNAAYRRQMEILISEFLMSDDLELKYYISLQLPKEIDDFPVPIGDKAEKYLSAYKKQNIPTCYSELEAALKAKNRLD